MKRNDPFPEVPSMMTYLRPRPISRPLTNRPVYWVAPPRQPAAYAVRPRSLHQPTGVQPSIVPQLSLPIELTDQGDVFVVRASLPGLAANQLDIQASRAAIAIAAHLTEQLPPFRRVLNLPSPIQHTQIKASLADGMLSLILPKARPTAPQTVKVVVAPSKVPSGASSGDDLEPKIPDNQDIPEPTAGLIERAIEDDRASAQEKVVMASPTSWEPDPDLTVDLWAAA